MNEQEFVKLLDEYQGTGYDFYKVQKKWAYMAAKKMNQSLEKRNKELEETEQLYITKCRLYEELETRYLNLLNLKK